MDREKYIEKFRSIFTEYIFKKDDFDKLIFWGIGATTETWWDDMIKANLIPKYIIDSKKAHTNYKDFELTDPKDLGDIHEYIIVIMTTNPYTYQEILSQIEQEDIKAKMVCSCSAIYYWNYRGRIINMLKKMRFL